MEKRIFMGQCARILHGGDYNPDQWLDNPGILTEDISLMKKARVNCVSLGIFSWSKLEPQEGRYELDWLEEIIDRLYRNEIYTILATPTGAIPPWLGNKYEEVLQMDETGVRNFAGNRHNYCPSSPVMRKKMRGIDHQLAERFGRRPGVIGWHISNEIAGNGRDGSCHCPYCQQAFRTWLKEKYGSLEKLNHAWWTDFWSHTYTDWSQIRSASKRGENLVHGQTLDWKRFVSRQLLDFCKEEIRVVREYSDLPVTANMMGFFKPLNYFEWGKELDVISWDCYPDWHSGDDELETAAHTAAAHALMRSLKKQPFLMMESTPSVVNWRKINRLKRPGMHALSSLQAVGCGSDSVQYFQWRKGRGGCEKYHGAVIDHRNGSDTRVFRDVEALGKRLEKISGKVTGTRNKAKTALVFDWENWWAVEDAFAIDNDISYPDIFLKFFRPLWEMGLETDMIDMEGNLDEYEAVIAPLNYMYRGTYAQKVRKYVEQGGCYITTCWSGETDDTDLAFLGKHPLEDVLGICPEETDAPSGYCENRVAYRGTLYQTEGICGLVHTVGAQTLAEYTNDFYAGYPAVTCNHFGKGEAYYIASINEAAFLKDFYRDVLGGRGIRCRFHADLPCGVTVNTRTAVNADGTCEKELWFVQNFNRGSAEIRLTDTYRDIETGAVVNGTVQMQQFECRIFEAAGG